jgi:hypothetical protein
MDTTIFLWRKRAMSKKSIIIASILLLIILGIIGIGIGIASASKLAVVELRLNTTVGLHPASKLNGLAVRRDGALLKANLKEGAAAKDHLLHVDAHELS